MEEDEKEKEHGGKKVKGKGERREEQELLRGQGGRSTPSPSDGNPTERLRP